MAHLLPGVPIGDYESRYRGPSAFKGNGARVTGLGDYGITMDHLLSIKGIGARETGLYIGDYESTVVHT